MIKIKIGLESYPVQQFTFAGGEVQIKIDPTLDFTQDIILETVIRSSDDLIALFLTKEAIDWKSCGFIKVHLILKYFPYARQDRRCQEGESDAMIRISSMINRLGFDSIQVWDLHNEDMLSYINKVIHVEQYKLIGNLWKLYDFVVSPDMGAKPKISKITNLLTPDIIVGEKVRDPSTGEITHTEIHHNLDLVGSSVIIIDDICDGGRTFIELAKILREEGVKDIGLYVTHGIFSKGLGVFRGLIDRIYTTDSFYDQDSTDFITVLDR